MLLVDVLAAAAFLVTLCWLYHHTLDQDELDAELDSWLADE